MKVSEAVQGQLDFWYGIIDGLVAECDAETLHKRLPGATIGSIASTYAHMVMGEDTIVHQMFQGKPSLFDSGGWAAKLGVTHPGPMQNLEWAETVKLDPKSFGEYAKAVYADTRAYLAGLTDADLERKVQSPLGEQPLAAALAGLLATHYIAHAGEVCALRGIQGGKGLPF